MQVNGTITNIRSEQKLNKAKGTTFTINWLSVEGFDAEINVGWKKGFVVGQPFVAEVHQNKFNQWEPVAAGTMSPVVSTGQAAPVQQQRSGGIQNAKYPVPAGDPQNIIINQNALAHACKIVEIFHSQFDYETSAVVSLDSITDQVLSIAPKMASFSSGRLTQEAYEKLASTPELQHLIASQLKDGTNG